MKVLDFGLVKAEGRPTADDLRLTAPESMAGTPAYLAPELASGETVDGRADLYALGCVGYFLLTGTLVFGGETPVQLILKHLQAVPEPPSARLGSPVPGPLEQLILVCLSKDPSRRPASAGELGAALDRAGADEWTQEDARRWWETSFTAARTSEAGQTIESPAPAGRVVEVALPGTSA